MRLRGTHTPPPIVGGTGYTVLGYPRRPGYTPQTTMWKYGDKLQVTTGPAPPEILTAIRVCGALVEGTSPNKADLRSTLALCGQWVPREEGEGVAVATAVAAARLVPAPRKRARVMCTETLLMGAPIPVSMQRRTHLLPEFDTTTDWPHARFEDWIITRAAVTKALGLPGHILGIPVTNQGEHATGDDDDVVVVPTVRALFHTEQHEDERSPATPVAWQTLIAAVLSVAHYDTRGLPPRPDLATVLVAAIRHLRRCAAHETGSMHLLSIAIMGIGRAWTTPSFVPSDATRRAVAPHLCRLMKFVALVPSRAVVHVPALIGILALLRVVAPFVPPGATNTLVSMRIPLDVEDWQSIALPMLCLIATVVTDAETRVIAADNVALIFQHALAAHEDTSTVLVACLFTMSTLCAALPESTADAWSREWSITPRVTAAIAILIAIAVDAERLTDPRVFLATAVALFVRSKHIVDDAMRSGTIHLVNSVYTERFLGILDDGTELTTMIACLQVATFTNVYLPDAKKLPTGPKIAIPKTVPRLATIVFAARDAPFLCNYAHTAVLAAFMLKLAVVTGYVSGPAASSAILLGASNARHIMKAQQVWTATPSRLDLAAAATHVVQPCAFPAYLLQAATSAGVTIVQLVFAEVPWLFSKSTYVYAPPKMADAVDSFLGAFRPYLVSLDADDECRNRTNKVYTTFVKELPTVVPEKDAPWLTDTCCAICLDDAGSEPWTLLPCSHTFHHTCILSAVRNGVRACPTCRMDMSAGVAVPLLWEVAAVRASIATATAGTTTVHV